MRVILADDSAIIREGVAALLGRRSIEVQASASSAPELLNVVHAHRDDLPDLVITDVRMPPNMRDDGLQAAVSIRETYPGLGVVVLSQYVATRYATTLFATAPTRHTRARDHSGGIGYLLKDRIGHVSDFIRALEVVEAGGVVIDPDVTEAMMRQNTSGLAHLTPRETEVLALMARGDSNADIASALVLSSAAVAKHVSSIFAKLGMTPHEDNRRVRAILLYLAHSDPL
ncbi:response regulator transcription factor [Nanchangia anserum]|uniref:Response regulator transcription factor n=1 Tax=Nanchangia anserum TaxID=2692125 RepID=A0A8I0KTT2_9ACTO|nr:response regulator transcription factor [Nanchangia anserum]MBD3688928.1 response regulator transcription factor [Nanchangia anserum]QOX81195.1 response regulator transcription factor [Nanchangia anserum]